MSSQAIKELEYIDAIIKYFKAWEYFLLRPSSHWHDTLKTKHATAVKNLQDHVKSMLTSLSSRPPKDSKHGLFIDQLLKVHADHPIETLVQSVLEMMIAGTDTSSVTAYYALLQLSSDKKLQSELRQDINANKECQYKSKLLQSVVNETLRFKPVGPVVLREASYERFINGVPIFESFPTDICILDMHLQFFS